MPSLRLTAIIIVGILAMLLLSFLEQRDAEAEQAAYCERVRSGADPDYKGNYRANCGEPAPHFSENFFLRSLDADE